VTPGPAGFLRTTEREARGGGGCDGTQADRRG
jgi:hypothetical protein